MLTPRQTLTRARYRLATEAILTPVSGRAADDPQPRPVDEFSDVPLLSDSPDPTSVDGYDTADESKRRRRPQGGRRVVRWRNVAKLLGALLVVGLVIYGVLAAMGQRAESWLQRFRPPTDVAFPLAETDLACVESARRHLEQNDSVVCVSGPAIGCYKRVIAMRQPRRLLFGDSIDVLVNPGSPELTGDAVQTEEDSPLFGGPLRCKRSTGIRLTGLSLDRQPKRWAVVDRQAAALCLQHHLDILGARELPSVPRSCGGASPP